MYKMADKINSTITSGQMNTVACKPSNNGMSTPAPPPPSPSKISSDIEKCSKCNQILGKSENNNVSYCNCDTVCDPMIKKVMKTGQEMAVLRQKPPPVPVKRKKLQSASSGSREDILNSVKTVTNKRQRVEEISRNSPPKLQVHQEEVRVVTKPPLPPKPDATVLSQVKKIRSPKLKKKIEETNAAVIQKLNAYAEQLRMEIATLKSALTTEKNAVRSLRAQNDSTTRKAKAEMKKLQDALLKKVSTVTVVKKSQPHKEESSSSDTAPAQLPPVSPLPSTTTTSVAVSTEDDTSELLLDVVQELNQEISGLKMANQALEEKIQTTSEEQKRKSGDIIYELKDSYEMRLTQISKSAKIEIHRLLEEIKSKDKSIRLLKKELLHLKESQKKDTKNADNPNQEMRKLKEIERNKSSTNNQNKILATTTCGNDYGSMPHEMPERILEAHNELHLFRNKDPTGSDEDSALSSAPPSLSPQPNSPEDVWQTFTTKEPVCHDTLQKEIDFLQAENDALKGEVCSAKEQIRELERALLVTREGGRSQQLIDKIKYLEQKETMLSKEAHELKEQNELLEFRIIELEESHDKWSLRSNSTPDTRDVWTDTEKENDDILMLSERSDSGVTSPHSHHHLDDRNSLPSPCDLSIIDNIPNDDVRKRIMAMSKKSCYDEDDKLCLLQVLSLLNNLEALSQDQEITGEFLSLELNNSLKHKFAIDYQSLENHRNTQLAAIPLKPQGRIVATVQPYSSSGLAPEDPIRPQITATIISSSPNSQDSLKKSKYWSSNNLQESGVFEGEPIEVNSQYTQTEPEDFPCPEKPSGDLTAEIQKLNKFRERIEECVTTNKASVAHLLSPEQRRLQYYKDRLEILENKILIYESSGDIQVRRLAERLQREIHLESLVKQLSIKIEELEKENQILDEERCEFEEAENDTRLRLQRLEVDFEILSQRNVELEISRDSLQSKVREAKKQTVAMEDSIQEHQEKIFSLEEQENDLRHKIELIKNAMPAILLYNSWKSTESDKDTNMESLSSPSRQSPTHLLAQQKSNRQEGYYQEKLNEFMNRERELQKNIAELNRAYNETLENADNLWAQMEKDYKDKLTKSENRESSLKAKLIQLENRLKYDAQFAQDRLVQMEEAEFNLKNKICKLNKDNKELLAKNTVLLEEVRQMKEEYKKLKNHLEGPAAEVREKERRKAKDLEEDLVHAQKLLRDMEEQHRDELTQLRNKVNLTSKELADIEVTNNELKEEVCTLETRIVELENDKTSDEEVIKRLTQELCSNKELGNVKSEHLQSLAQELGSESKNVEVLVDNAKGVKRLVEDTILDDRYSDIVRAKKTATSTEVSEDEKMHEFTEKIIRVEKESLENVHSPQALVVKEETSEREMKMGDTKNEQIDYLTEVSMKNEIKQERHSQSFEEEVIEKIENKFSQRQSLTKIKVDDNESEIKGENKESNLEGWDQLFVQYKLEEKNEESVENKEMETKLVTSSSDVVMPVMEKSSDLLKRELDQFKWELIKEMTIAEELAKDDSGEERFETLDAIIEISMVDDLRSNSSSSFSCSMCSTSSTSLTTKTKESPTQEKINSLDLRDTSFQEGVQAAASIIRNKVLSIFENSNQEIQATFKDLHENILKALSSLQIASNQSIRDQNKNLSVSNRS